jgi:hypothetical protein
LAIRWKRIGLNSSATMTSPDDASRWWTSATRPAMEFSTGIMARAQSPVFTASNAASKVGQGAGA